MVKDATLEERIHEIDLRDFERLQKLFSRLQSEIGGYQKNLQMIALAEAQLDHFRTGLIQDESVDESSIHNGIGHLKDNHIKQLQDLALEKPKSHSEWWFLGGIATGALITIGVVYAIK